jgi:hypothetical protein
MWFVILKCVSFRILQSGIRTVMLDFISVFVSFNRVCVSSVVLPGLQLEPRLLALHDMPTYFSYFSVTDDSQRSLTCGREHSDYGNVTS